MLPFEQTAALEPPKEWVPNCEPVCTCPGTTSAILLTRGMSGFQEREGNEMRIFVAFLIVLAVLYFWDANYNRGLLSDGVIRMGRSMFQHIGH